MPRGSAMSRIARLTSQLLAGTTTYEPQTCQDFFVNMRFFSMALRRAFRLRFPLRREELVHDYVKTYRPKRS
mgnify:CR=1 FL=1